MTASARSSHKRNGRNKGTQIRFGRLQKSDLNTKDNTEKHGEGYIGGVTFIQVSLVVIHSSFFSTLIR